MNGQQFGLRSSFLLQVDDISPMDLTFIKFVVCRILNFVEDSWACPFKWQWSCIVDQTCAKPAALPLSQSISYSLAGGSLSTHSMPSNWSHHSKDAFISFSSSLNSIVSTLSAVESTSRIIAKDSFEKVISAALKRLITPDHISNIITPARAEQRRFGPSASQFMFIICKANVYMEMRACLPASSVPRGVSVIWLILDNVHVDISSGDSVFALDMFFKSPMDVLMTMFTCGIDCSRRTCENPNQSTSISIYSDIISTMDHVQKVKYYSCLPAYKDDLLRKLEVFGMTQHCEDSESIEKQQDHKKAEASRDSKELEDPTDLGLIFMKYLYGDDGVLKFVNYFGKYKDELRRSLKTKYAAVIIDTGIRDVIQTVEQLKYHWMTLIFGYLKDNDLKENSDSKLKDEEAKLLMLSFEKWKQSSAATVTDENLIAYCRIMLCRSIELTIIVIFELFRSSLAKDKNVKSSLESHEFQKIKEFKNLKQYFITNAESLIDYLCIQFACIADIESSSIPATNTSGSRKFDTLFLDETTFFREVISNNRYAKTIPQLTTVLQQKFSTNFFSPAKPKRSKTAIGRPRKLSNATQRSLNTGGTDDLPSSQMCSLSSDSLSSRFMSEKLKTNLVCVQLPVLSQTTSTQSQSQQSDTNPKLAARNFYGKSLQERAKQQPTKENKKPPQSRKRNSESANASNLLESKHESHFTPVKAMKLDYGHVVTETPVSTLSSRSLKRVLDYDTPTRPSPRLHLNLQALRLKSDLFVPDTPQQKK